jgi:hypothetical protein
MRVSDPGWEWFVDVEAWGTKFEFVGHWFSGGKWEMAADTGDVGVWVSSNK